MKESNTKAIDPICGMTVDTASAIHAERDGKTFYFCSEHCREKFQSTPTDAKSDDKSAACCGGQQPSKKISERAKNAAFAAQKQIHNRNQTMKYLLTMVIGCGLALLVIFLLMPLGLGGGWMLAVAFGALMLCHLMHFRMHKND